MLERWRHWGPARLVLPQCTHNSLPSFGKRSQGRYDNRDHLGVVMIVCDVDIILLVNLTASEACKLWVAIRATLKKRCVEGTGHERGPTGTVWRLCRGARRSDRARGSGRAVAGLLPGLAAAGRAQERRADRGGDGAGTGLGQAPVVAAFRRQRAVVGRAGPQPNTGIDPADHRRQRRDRSLDHRRHRLPQEGPSFGRLVDLAKLRWRIE